jgi:RimJ/RimL family protein N-acetyltransferase
MTPTISTSNLVLRKLSKASPLQVRWMLDPEVTRYSEQRHKNHTFTTQHRYVQSFMGASHLWAICLVKTGEHIGNLSADHDEPNSVADIGIMIGNADHWGRGYGTEAWRAACNWLLDKDGGKVRKLEAGCMATNEGMLKIIQHSGFKQEGERLNRYLIAGNPVSAILFGRFK